MDNLLKQERLTDALALAWSFYEGKAKAVVGKFGVVVGVCLFF